jgi:hypothetical protein
MTAVASSPAAGRTAFILHGDHGSRIMDVEPNIKNMGKFTEDDLVNGHGAFFAVAGNDIEPGYDRARYPLQMLLAALVDAKFQTLAVERPDDFKPSLAIEDSHWNTKRSLPVGDLKWWRVE